LSHFGRIIISAADFNSYKRALLYPRQHQYSWASWDSMGKALPILHLAVQLCSLQRSRAAHSNWTLTIANKVTRTKSCYALHSNGLPSSTPIHPRTSSRGDGSWTPRSGFDVRWEARGWRSGLDCEHDHAVGVVLDDKWLQADLTLTFSNTATTDHENISFPETLSRPIFTGSSG
jgi:hypothetical protein